MSEIMNFFYGYTTNKLATDPEINPVQMIADVPKSINNVIPLDSPKNDPSKYTNSGAFNSALFNKDFEIINEEQNEIAQNIENNKLMELNNSVNNNVNNRLSDKSLVNMSLNEILIEWYNSFNGIFNDFIYTINIFNYNTSNTVGLLNNNQLEDKNLEQYKQIITKNNRLFYIGLTILIIGICGYILIKLMNEILKLDE